MIALLFRMSDDCMFCYRAACHLSVRWVWNKDGKTWPICLVYPVPAMRVRCHIPSAIITRCTTIATPTAMEWDMDQTPLVASFYIMPLSPHRWAILMEPCRTVTLVSFFAIPRRFLSAKLQKSRLIDWKNRFFFSFRRDEFRKRRRYFDESHEQ